MSDTDSDEPVNLLFQLNYNHNAEDFHSDISDQFGENYHQQVLQMLIYLKKLFFLILGKVHGFEMLIPFIDETDIKGLKQSLFNLFMRDHWVMDKILNELLQTNWTESVSLSHLLPAASPAFIVWRNGKLWVVIDLCHINTKL